MRLAAIFASAFAVFAVQCGGQVDEPCPSTPSDSCVQEGKACTFATTSCGMPANVTCTCKDGSYACPVHSCPIEACPVDTYPGASCSSKGLQCESMQSSQCVDLPIMCTCNGSTFECAVPDCPPPPPPSCPPPDTITPGAACSLPPNSDCQGTDQSDCFCNGTWACAYSVDAGPPIDAGSSD